MEFATDAPNPSPIARHATGRPGKTTVRCKALLAVVGRLALASALAASAGSCVTESDKADAIRTVNKVFCERYESIISERGTRVVRLPRQDVYTAMRAALAGLDMKLENQDPKLGIFSVYAPAPLPLNQEEWERISREDLPLLRKLAEPNIGWLPTYFLHFEPGGLQVVITATVVEVREGASVSLTVRLREVSPPQSGYPRRECLSPTVLGAGLDKIWAAFDREVLGELIKS